MWNCKTCDETNEDSYDSCWKCGLYHGETTTKAEAQALNTEMIQRMDATHEKCCSSINELLECLVGEIIGINVSSPHEAEAARLIAVKNDYFIVETQELTHYIPFSKVIRVTRGRHGTVNSGIFSAKFSVIIKIFDLVQNSGNGIAMAI